MNWPTPTARDWKDTGNMENVPENALLGRAVLNWSTPRSTDGEKGGPNMSFGAGGLPLPAQASQWMTPRVSETGQYQYNKGNPDDPILTLQGQSQWYTPQVQYDGRTERALLIARSRAAERHTSGQYGKGTGKPTMMDLQRQASSAPFLSSRPGPAIDPNGKPSLLPILSAFQRYRLMTDLSLRAEMRVLIRRAIRAERRGERRAHTRKSFRRSLNAIFVGWLMGWAPGFTRLALNSSACSATALCRYKQRMRSELCALGLPEAAAPVQLGLFH